MNNQQLASEKLLQVYYNFKGLGVDLDRTRENIFKDKELTKHFCRFLKYYFKMIVPARALFDNETLGEALDSLIPYLPEDTARFYFNMMTIYCLICEDTDNKLYEAKQQLKMQTTSMVVKICFICGMILGVIVLMFCTWGADAESILATYNIFDQTNSISWLSTGTLFYIGVALIPIMSAFCCTILGGLTYAVYSYLYHKP